MDLDQFASLMIAVKKRQINDSDRALI